MNFESSLKEGFAKVVAKNKSRAKSLMRSGDQAIETAQIMPLNETSIKSVFRELYEGLRQHCEAIGFAYGYKFSSHETITYFLRDILGEARVADKFDRYRKLRNGINYYGDEIEIVSVKEALEEIPRLVSVLKKYFEEENEQ